MQHLSPNQIIGDEREVVLARIASCISILMLKRAKELSLKSKYFTRDPSSSYKKVVEVVLSSIPTCLLRPMSKHIGITPKHAQEMGVPILTSLGMKISN
jgi:hypothetical protein